MRSLDDVGQGKAVGYLPLATLKNVLRISADKIRESCEARGLNVKIFDEDSSCIKSGAIFVYDTGLVRGIIDRFDQDILARGWSGDVESIIERIAIEWYCENDPAMPFIKALYGE
ncbi:hypothetical protein [Methylocystis parvus]|uniref:Uncharacterized protein n=1 Tax=Methylocystis parvus TaxID=134 RepID=A0A6B8M8I4_9HYPH|nr:hypothetical protein [Methylocystis parvus]QGM97939.1 hypothetical protein F7D14_10955 [Methylocystis parvus]WBK01749.1 hypothetical protein MMG94_08620 [Methylocystis parvus OBBP]